MSEAEVAISALGQKSAAAQNTEVILIGYFSLFTQQKISFENIPLQTGWLRVPAMVKGIEFNHCLMSYSGTLSLPHLLGGVIAVVSHPWSGHVGIETGQGVKQVDLFSEETKTILIDTADGTSRDIDPSEVQKLRNSFSDALADTGSIDQRETASHQQIPTASRTVAFFEQRHQHYMLAVRQIDASQPLALYVPKWVGVATSTKSLFAQTLPFPQNASLHPSDITVDDIKYLASILLATRCRHFVVSGGDIFWIDVIRHVLVEDASIRFDLLWHSNYLQMGEAHDWNLLKHWLDAVAKGLVRRVAVVKNGLEALFQRLGVDALFIPNIIRANPSEIRYNGKCDSAGIWLSGSSSYRKLPHASLLAMKALPDIKLTGAGFDDESLAMVTDMRIMRGEIWRDPLPQEALHRAMQKTSVTLYVTLSECSPMLPLESLHLGVPCLVGANSHLFRSSPYLYKTLVVESPLSSQCIAQHARLALAEGVRIIEAFAEYSFNEQKFAEAALAKFLC